MEILETLKYHEIGPHLLDDMFRILHLDRAANLEPGADDEIIETNLLHSTLRENPSFTALSYCWDVPQPQAIVLCNGKKTTIRSNLHAALRRLRLPHESKAVWADAICINQSNLEERARQVGLMKDIYQIADDVVVWLGEESEDSDIGMEAAQDLADAGRVYRKQGGGSFDNLPLDDPLVISVFGRFRRSLELSRFNALSKIIDRDWFGRTWVVQEVAVAAKVTMQCGGKSMSWDDFMDAVLIQSRLELYTSTHDRNASPLFLIKTRNDFQNGVSHDLLTVMYRHRVFDSTDPRDQIYGIGGLADGPVAKKFMSNIDYTIEPLVLYRQVATEMLKNSPGLSVLSVPPGLGSDHPVGLPSWAPDWRVTRQSPCLGLINEDDIYQLWYKASGDSQPSVQFDETGMLLGLECCFVDSIEAVASVMVVDNILSGYPGVLRLPKIAYMLDEWRSVTRVLKDVDCPTADSALDAFIQSLVGAPPRLKMDFLREQYGILDRQARLIRWMRRLEQIIPVRTQPSVAKLLAKMLGIPKSSIAFDFGVSTCPLADRTVFRSKKGYVGVVSRRAAVGDQIAIPKGGKVPLVLRPGEKKWILRGDCFVHGIMQGEAYDESRLETVWIA